MPSVHILLVVLHLLICLIHGKNIRGKTRSEEPTTTTEWPEETTTIDETDDEITTLPEKTDETTASPKKSVVTTTTPMKSDVTTIAPKKSDVTTAAPKKSEVTTTTPKKSDVTTAAPRKSDVTTAAPRKSHTTTAPKKNDATTTAPRKARETTNAPKPRSDAHFSTEVIQIVKLTTTTEAPTTKPWKNYMLDKIQKKINELEEDEYYSGEDPDDIGSGKGAENDDETNEQNSESGDDEEAENADSEGEDTGTKKYIQGPNIAGNQPSQSNYVADLASQGNIVMNKLLSKPTRGSWTLTCPSPCSQSCAPACTPQCCMDNFAMAPPVPENKKGMSLCPNFCTSMNCPSSCPSYCCALSSIVPSNQGGGIIETDNTVSTRPCPDVCSSYGPTNCPGQCTSSCCTGQTWNQPSISEPLAIQPSLGMPSMGMPSVDQYSMSQQFMGQPSMIQQPPISSLIAQPAVSQPMVGQMPTSFPGVDVSYQYGYPPFSADQMAHADSDLCASYCTNTASCTPAGLCPPSCCQK